MPLPETYSELYPGRFLKADLLKGRKVTLTVKSINVEDLIGDKGKEPKVVVAFVERPLEYVMPKTCGFALMRMFGKNPREWAGKRVTFYPTTTNFGRETVDCIRVWGSPDIAADFTITIPQGRKKPLEATMHKIKAGECGFRGDPAPGIVAPATVAAESEVTDAAHDGSNITDWQYQPSEEA